MMRKLNLFRTNRCTRRKFFKVESYTIFINYFISNKCKKFHTFNKRIILQIIMIRDSNEYIVKSVHGCWPSNTSKPKY